MRQHESGDLPDFAPVLKEADKLIQAYTKYCNTVDVAVFDKANSLQRKPADTLAPFFTGLHELLKVVDKAVRHIEKEQTRDKDLKSLKAELEMLHREARATEYFFGHITWLQERFPKARYEDVTGLCKVAAPGEVAEQEYFLNPGRYVGVVIEEDGMSEEGFIDEMPGLNTELEKLNAEALKLEKVIGKNIRLIAGEE